MTGAPSAPILQPVLRGFGPGASVPEGFGRKVRFFDATESLGCMRSARARPDSSGQRSAITAPMRKPRHRLRSALWRPHRLSKPRIIRRPRCASGGAQRRCNGDDRAQPGNGGGLRAEAATRMRRRCIEVDVQGWRTARGAGHERRRHGGTEAGLSQGYPAEGKRWRQKLDARSRKVDGEEGRHRRNADECSSIGKQTHARKRYRRQKQKHRRYRSEGR